MTEPTMEKIKEIARSAKTPKEAEQLIIDTFHGLPNELLDPLKLTEATSEAQSGVKGSEATGATFIDAHLSNFGQAYEGRLPDPKAIGFQRNVEDQGMPGTKVWMEAQKDAKPQQPAKEVPPTTKG